LVAVILEAIILEPTVWSACFWTTIMTAAVTSGTPSFVRMTTPTDGIMVTSSMRIVLARTGIMRSALLLHRPDPFRLPLTVSLLPFSLFLRHAGFLFAQGTKVFDVVLLHQAIADLALALMADRDEHACELHLMRVETAGPGVSLLDRGVLSLHGAVFLGVECFERFILIAGLGKGRFIDRIVLIDEVLDNLVLARADPGFQSLDLGLDRRDRRLLVIAQR
jgi:hypothetical protein